MHKVKLQFRSKLPMQVLGSDGEYHSIAQGETLTLLDAYTQEDDTDIAVLTYEDSITGRTFECALNSILPHIECVAQV
jgi:hypothetical protein